MEKNQAWVWECFLVVGMWMWCVKIIEWGGITRLLKTQRTTRFPVPVLCFNLLPLSWPNATHLGIIDYQSLNTSITFDLPLLTIGKILTCSPFPINCSTSNSTCNNSCLLQLNHGWDIGLVSWNSLRVFFYRVW